MAPEVETIAAQPQQLKSITWEAPEHHHVEKSPEWFAVVGIITVAATAAAWMIGNVLLAALLLLAGIVTALATMRTPETIPFAVTTRGVRVDERLYPYSSLESYCIDEEDPKGPQLIVKGNRLIMPLIILPLPEDEVDDIEDLIASKLPEEHLEEPLFSKIMEAFGF